MGAKITKPYTERFNDIMILFMKGEITLEKAKSLAKVDKTERFNDYANMWAEKLLAEQFDAQRNNKAE